MKLNAILGLVLVFSSGFVWAQNSTCIKSYDKNFKIIMYNSKVFGNASKERSLVGAAKSPAKEMKIWSANYNKLLDIFSKTENQTIENYKLFLSGENDPSDLKAFTLQIWKDEDPQPMGFSMYSPKNHNGEIQVEKDAANNTFIYRQSDLAGWVVLKLQVNNKNELVGARLSKTLGYDSDGKYHEYDVGLAIGTLNGPLEP